MVFKITSKLQNVMVTLQNLMEILKCFGLMRALKLLQRS